MDTVFWKSLLDYGVVAVLAVVMFLWLIRVDIPKRERRAERQLDKVLEAHEKSINKLIEEFARDRGELLNKLEAINVAVINSSRTCAVNRSLGMVQYLMEKENLTFEQASIKVREHWKLNGIKLD